MAHHDPQIWGEDASVFRPERWLETDTGGAKLMEPNFLAVDRTVTCTRLRTTYDGVSDPSFSSVKVAEPA
jgi:hypothetical protein